MKKFKVFWFALLFVSFASVACTSFMFPYKHQAIVARNFDWINNNTDVVINPIGKVNRAMNLPKTVKPLVWKAKYGSVTFDLTTGKGRLLQSATQGGMNQKGLVVSLLELDNAKFPTPNPNYPTLHNTSLTQYWLDEFATVKQALSALKKINVIPIMWRGKPVPIHYALYDASGDSAVVEYVDGKLIVVHGKAMTHKLLTNTVYTQAVGELKTYKPFGGDQAMPGDHLSLSRFVRGAAFLKHLPKARSEQQAVGYAFSGLQSAAELPGTPYPTVWSVVYNTHTLKLYYRTLSDPFIRQLDLKQLHFDKMRVVPINGGSSLRGE